MNVPYWVIKYTLSIFNTSFGTFPLVDTVTYGILFIGKDFTIQYQLPLQVLKTPCTSKLFSKTP